MNKPTNFKCTYCEKEFNSEHWFHRHQCKQMLRNQQFNLPIGQSAWMYYQRWMKQRHKFVPNVKTFLTSRAFNAFIRFAEFVRKVKIPDTKIYISLMIDLDIPPVMWTNDQIYSAFLEHMDNKISLQKTLTISLHTLVDIAEESGKDVSDVFNVIEPGELIQLLRQRRISPWVLLNSDKFKDYYQFKVPHDTKIILQTLIRPQYWSEKIKNNPRQLETVRKCITKLNL